MTQTLRSSRSARLIGLVIMLLWRHGIATCSAAAEHQLAIGVVNTMQVLRNMQETKKLDADFRAKNTDLAVQQHQRETEMADLQKHRDQDLLPGSAQWTDQTEAIDRKHADLEVWKSISSVQLERWYKQHLKGVYDHITPAAGEVAQKQGLDLVIADQSPDIGPDLEKANISQLEAALAARAVLFSNKKADITQDVLAQVEANYANANRQGPPAGPIGLPSPGAK